MDSSTPKKLTCLICINISFRTHKTKYDITVCVINTLPLQWRIYFVVWPLNKSLLPIPWKVIPSTDSKNTTVHNNNNTKYIGFILLDRENKTNSLRRSFASECIWLACHWSRYGSADNQVWEVEIDLNETISIESALRKWVVLTEAFVEWSYYLSMWSWWEHSQAVLPCSLTREYWLLQYSYYPKPLSA